MKKWVSLLLVAVILAAAIPLVGCGGEKEAYKVGAIFAETGVNSSLGTPEAETVEMMVEKINADGGINGHKLEVVIYDTKSDSNECALVTQRLIEQDKVLAIVGPSSTGESIFIRAAVTEAEVPLISCAAGATIVNPVSDAYWVFKTPQSDVLAVHELYNYMKNVKGYTQIGIMTDTGGYGKGGKAFLESEAASYGITIVANETFDPAGTDMTAQLTNIKNTSAQAFVCWTTSQGAAIVATNRTAINMTMPLFCSHGVANTTFIKNGGASANGVIFPAGKLLVAGQLDDSDPQKEVLLKYKTDFEAKYSGKTADTFGGHAYDALNMVVEALEKVGPDKAQIRDYIESQITDWAGTGGVFNMSASDHNGLTAGCFIMVEVVNGEWHWLKTS